jgi:tight adherence protein C
MQTIIDQLDPAHARLLFMLLVSGAGALLGVALAQLGSGWFAPSRQRVKQFMGQGRIKPHIPFKKQLIRLMVAMSTYVTPNAKESARIRQQMAYIGYDNKNVFAFFFVVKFTLGMALGAVVLFASHFTSVTTFQWVIVVGGSSFAGMLIPNMLLNQRCQERQENFQRSFPDSLDILLVCVEAGLGLNAAIQRVADELTISHPLLAEQYAMINEEIRIGVDRVEALRNLAVRTGLKDAENLVNLLAQSMKYGVSVVETLRIFSSELRLKRMQRAEEKAAMVGTKLIFPLVLCIFPAFFIIIVGPAVIGVINALSQ